MTSAWKDIGRGDYLNQHLAHWAIIKQVLLWSKSKNLTWLKFGLFHYMRLLSWELVCTAAFKSPNSKAKHPCIYCLGFICWIFMLLFSTKKNRLVWVFVLNGSTRFHCKMPKGCSVTVVIQFKPQSQRPRDQLAWGKCISANGLAKRWRAQDWQAH